MKKDSRRIYVAVRHVPHTAPEISWTKGGIAKAIGAHRNSLGFVDGMARVKGWLIYEMEIDSSISSLGRGSSNLRRG